jgi:hypothetical protein
MSGLHSAEGRSAAQRNDKIAFLHPGDQFARFATSRLRDMACKVLVSGALLRTITTGQTVSDPNHP